MPSPSRGMHKVMLHCILLPRCVGLCFMAAMSQMLWLLGAKCVYLPDTPEVKYWHGPIEGSVMAYLIGMILCVERVAI